MGDLTLSHLICSALSCSGTTRIVVLFCAAIPVILALPRAYAAIVLKEIAVKILSVSAIATNAKIF
jgi:hypothetical protein